MDKTDVSNNLIMVVAHLLHKTHLRVRFLYGNTELQSVLQGLVKWPGLHLASCLSSAVHLSCDLG